MRTGTGTGSDHGTTGGLLLGLRIQGLGVGFASGQIIISCAVALAATMASQVEWFLSVYILSQLLTGREGVAAVAAHLVGRCFKTLGVPKSHSTCS